MPKENSPSIPHSPTRAVSNSTANPRRPVCCYCFNEFDVDQNDPGSCPEAPDTCLPRIDQCSCMFCFERVHYLMELNTAEPRMEHPWTALKRCSSARVWITAIAFSLCLPGLCCYPLLRACRAAGIQAGMIGGRHVPMMRKQKSMVATTLTTAGTESSSGETITTAPKSTTVLTTAETTTTKTLTTEPSLASHALSTSAQKYSETSEI